MKIIQQLANWLLETDRISTDEYQNVLTAIMGGVCDKDKPLFTRALVRKMDRDAVEDSFEEWWDLRGAGERAHVKSAGRKGGRKAAQNTTPINVVELEPRLPEMLMPAGTSPDTFPLAVLLIAVDNARCSRRAANWAGFAAAVESLYKASAEELHNALFAAMKIRGRELGAILAAAETNSTLFPEGFLSKLSGESVIALRRHIENDETAFLSDKEDWILRYPSFNVVNEACLVRNRLRRIYRLWVKTFADWDANGIARNGKAGICLTFGKFVVSVPAIVWWKLQDPKDPHIGSARGLVVFPDEEPFLNILVDRCPAVFYDSRCIDPPEPPCAFGWIRGEGLEKLKNPIQVLWPIVRQNENVPVLSLPDAPETVCWSNYGWAFMVARECRLSTGELAENKCPWRVLHFYPSVSGWVDLLTMRPDLPHEFPWDMIDKDYISDKLWCKILAARPDFAEHAPWNEFGVETLVCIFSSSPVLAESYDWNSLSAYSVVKVLEKCPKIIESSLKRLSNANTWLKIFAEHPEWAEYCPWDSLSNFALGLILRDFPDFADCCDWKKMNGWAYSKILQRHPQFADRCDLEKLDGCDWGLLIHEQPQFADKCDWQKLNGRAWSNVLRAQPQYADLCDWEKLNGSDWGYLLIGQPQFADKCDTSKINSGTWQWILEYQPQLAYLCDWEKLSGEDWLHLLRYQPRFANLCNWNKMAQWQISELIRAQPKLSAFVPSACI